MAKAKNNIFEKFMLLIGMAIAFGLCLGAFAGQISPQTSILIAFAGLAYPFLLIANVLVALFWIFRKKWLFAVLTLAIVGVGYKTFTVTYQFGGTEGKLVKASEDHIRFLTYNVHQFKKYGEKNDISTRDQIFAVLEEQSPDVICFQEFFTRRKGDYDLIDSVKKRLGLKYYYFVPAIGNEYEEVGLAIFSKFPIKDKGRIAFGNQSANQSIYVDLKVGDSLFRVYNVHFQSISFQQQDYAFIDNLSAKVEGQYRPARRIAAMLKNAFNRRAEQVKLMKVEMKSCQIPFVIAGDFNDTPASYCVTQITDELKNTFREKGSGFGKTYNGAFPNFQIDYIAATPAFDVINHKVIQAKLSDHFPVRADLKVN